MEDMVSSDVAYFVKLASLGVIGVSGTICNGISLSFFLRHQRESLADLHLIALNFTDLMISCLSTASLFCLSRFASQRSGKDTTVALLDLIVIESFLSLSNLSCFITTMLSVLRTLVLTNPLHIIRKNYVYLAHGINMIFGLGLVTSKVIEHRMGRGQTESSQSSSELIFILCVIQFLYVLITVGIVGTSSVIVVKALRRPPEIQTQQTERPNNEANRKATIMILILSVIFVVMNCAWCIGWAIGTVISHLSATHSEINVMLLGLFLMAINSCANPVVYILRNSRLNNYAMSLFRRLKLFFSSNIGI